MPTDGFDDAWSTAEPVPGWLTRAQARMLWDDARTAGRRGAETDGEPAQVVEIGSHQGRSTLVLAAALAGTGVEVVAIDPFVAGGMFGGPSTRERFEANLVGAGVADRVRLIAERSGDVRPSWTRPLAMLYIDGKHDYWTVRDDLRWSECVEPGAAVLIHDAFSSIGVTLALLIHVFPGRRLTYTGRAGSLARFVVGPPTGRDRLRMLAELPWWLRNVLIKIGLRVGRLFGYRRPDPF